MKKKLAILFTSLACMALVALLLRHSGMFGAPAARLEQNARENQYIDPTWSVSKTIDKNLAALLFYDDTKTDFVFSIYQNRPGLSFGYFFVCSGRESIIAEEIGTYVYGDSVALLSMNTKKVAKIEAAAGEEPISLAVDPDEPFAVVLPASCGEITLYDANGKAMPFSVSVPQAGNA